MSLRTYDVLISKVVKSEPALQLFSSDVKNSEKNCRT